MSAHRTAAHVYFTSNDSISRFTKGNPCPVCGGSDEHPRHRGERCHGFLSSDREWVHCSREEYAGKCVFHRKSGTWSHCLHGSCPCGVTHNPGPPSGNGKPKANGKPRPATTIDHDHPIKVYIYFNDSKIPAFQVRRLNVLDESGKVIDKTFRQYRWNGTEYVAGLGKTKTLLYRLPELLAADLGQLVWICEGEKDADRLAAAGLLATTCPMGAGKWDDRFSEVLRGRSCVVLVDNDNAGRKDAQQKAQSLAGKAASVRVVGKSPACPRRAT